MQANINHCQQLHNVKPYLEQRLLLLRQRSVKAQHPTLVPYDFIQTFEFVSTCMGYKQQNIVFMFTFSGTTGFSSALNLYNTHMRCNF